jgi:serine/threonine-protein kinase
MTIATKTKVASSQEGTRRVNPVNRGNAQSLPAIGAVVAAKYRVERTLAEGGMGVVVAATHLHLGRAVAIKFLRADMGDVHAQWDAFARFLLEAKAVARLTSEHVAHVLDAGVTDEGTPYTVMEYLEGSNLARLLEVQGQFDVTTAVEYAIQVSEGLAEAHSLGIVHRDIKPYNLILVERSPGWRSIKIVDFGISKVALPDMPKVVTGVIIGTPCYMSPEQLRSTAGVDHRSDIWSLGATLFELLAGRAAFDASLTLPELVAAILEKPSPSLRKACPEVPDGLEAIVTRCLEKDRAARFQSAGQLAMALLAFTRPRARVHAERAAAMKPLDVFSLTSESSLEVTAHDGSAVQPGAPKPSAQALTGPSLAPVTVAAPEISESPTPPPRTTLGDRAQKEEDIVVADGATRRRSYRWLRAPAVAAAVLLLGVLLKATRGGSRESPANQVTKQFVGAPALTPADAPPPPSVALTPLETSQKESAQVAGLALMLSPKVPLDMTAAHGSFPLAVSRNRSPAAPPRSTKRVADPAAPPTASMQATTPTSALSNGGQVDPMGGKMPLRPIETKDPYGSR